MIHPDILTIADIQRLIPHRYPMLLIDKVYNIVPNERATGLKNVTYNEWFFPGHFPTHPIMPGVLTIEAMAQTLAVLGVVSKEIEAGCILSYQDVYFMSINDAKFRHPIVPGDQVIIDIEVKSKKKNAIKCAGRATVDGKLVAEATLLAMMGNGS